MLMTKYLMIAIAALAVALGGSGWLLKRSYAQNGAQATQIGYLTQIAKQAQEQRKADTLVLARRAAANAVAARETASLRRRLDTALDVNRKWASEALPQDVQDALGAPN